MRERHSHAEAAARRRQVDLDQERRDTELADQWVAENGGWLGQPIHDDGDGAFVVSGESRPSDEGSEED